MTPLSLDLVARIIRSENERGIANWPTTITDCHRRKESGSGRGIAVDPPYRHSHGMWVMFWARHVDIKLSYRAQCTRLPGRPRSGVLMRMDWRLTHREWVELIAQPTLFEAT